MSVSKKGNSFPQSPNFSETVLVELWLKTNHSWNGYKFHLRYLSVLQMFVKSINISFFFAFCILGRKSFIEHCFSDVWQKENVCVQKEKEKKNEKQRKSKKEKRKKKKGNPPHPKGKKKEINKERRKKRKREENKERERPPPTIKNIYVKHKERVRARMRVHTHAYRRVCAHVHTGARIHTPHDGRRRPQQHKTPPKMPFALPLTAFRPSCGTPYHLKGKTRLKRLISRLSSSSPRPRSCSGFWHSIAA